MTQLAAAKAYDARFLELYNKITDPASGYFSPEGIPYHSVETLIVEAPDHGHETTSEAYSYLLWLQAMYGKVTGDWTKFNAAWDIMEKYMIPTHADQPTNSLLQRLQAGDLRARVDQPRTVPVAARRQRAGRPGPDRGRAEERVRHRRHLRHALAAGRRQRLRLRQRARQVRGGPADTGPSYINTFQRGPQESVWETVPQPTCDALQVRRQERLPGPVHR